MSTKSRKNKRKEKLTVGTLIKLKNFNKFFKGPALKKYLYLKQSLDMKEISQELFEKWKLTIPDVIIFDRHKASLEAMETGTSYKEKRETKKERKKANKHRLEAQILINPFFLFTRKKKMKYLSKQATHSIVTQWLKDHPQEKVVKKSLDVLRAEARSLFRGTFKARLVYVYGPRSKRETRGRLSGKQTCEEVGHNRLVETSA